jgi:hypothetical protein
LYVYLVHKNGELYSTWKWLSFFAPIIAASVAVIVFDSIGSILKGVRSRFIGVAALLVLLIVANSNALTIGLWKNEPPGISDDLRNLEYSAVIKPIRDLNVSIQPFYDNSWAVYFLRGRNLYMQQPNLLQLAKPCGPWTIYRIGDPNIPASGVEQIIVVNHTFELVRSDAPPCTNSYQGE